MLRRFLVAWLGLSAALSLLCWGLTSSANLLQMPFTTGGGGAVPVNTQGPTITGSIAAVSGGTLTCTNGLWTNGPTSYTYQFFHDGASLGAASSTNTYPIVAGDLGHLITCKTLASNGVGPATSQSPASNPAGNCTQSSLFFGRVWVLPATLDGTMGTSSGGIVSGGTLHLSWYDALICNLVTDTVWAKFDALWMPATNAATGSAQAVANLNLVSPSYTLVPNGSPTFTADRGYTGGTDANTTVWIDTGFNPATASGSQFGAVPGSSQISVWSLTAGVASTGYAKMLGSGNPGPSPAALIQTILISPWDKDNFFDCAVGYDTSVSVQARWSNTTTGAGHWLCEQTGADAYGFHNGAQQGSLIAATLSSAWFSGNVYLLNWNYNPPTGLNGSARQLAHASLGAALSFTAISSSGGTSGTGLVPRVCAYLFAVGAVTTAC